MDTISTVENNILIYRKIDITYCVSSKLSSCLSKIQISYCFINFAS